VALSAIHCRAAISSVSQAFASPIPDKKPDYNQQGQLAAIRLPGFPDLSQVPYAGCP
jgi:hypothetical protein